MLCDKCKQNNATVHITRIINGVMQEEHLCTQCAAASGQILGATQPIGWQHLLGGFTQPVQDKRCSQCGLSYSDFSRSGKMGCPQCYREFTNQVPELLHRIHGATRHVGKVPARGREEVIVDRKIKTMKEELAQLVAAEKFEEAAKLRDEIKNLEQDHSQQAGA